MTKQLLLVTLLFAASALTIVVGVVHYLNRPKPKQELTAKIDENWVEVPHTLPTYMSSTCSSPAPFTTDGWQPIKTAPRDGTVVEIMNTYGIHPWYDIYRWTREMKVYTFAPDVNDHDPRTFRSTADTTTITSKEPQWVSATRIARSIVESNCQFWRAYTGDVNHYVDPTGGHQFEPEYWKGLRK